jgi:tetratricopeptide (TPR) repeat protein
MVDHRTRTFVMARRAFVSRFSPNRTNPEILEAIFVQRHTLAEVWFERLRDSAHGGAKHHLLAVGPRGCGKSHLVALLVSRLKKNPHVKEKVRIAWLPEDETTPSFWKFLLRILRALNAEYGDEFPPPSQDQLANKADDRRAVVLTDYLLKKLGTRNLLVVVENLDDVMRGLKLEGQKRWRAFLQEHPVAATLASAQQLTKDVSDRDKPFFNFFQIERLQPLSADEALALLKNLAEQGDNAELVAFLKTPTGRARVRAIRHIAGGSHRVFIILSEFATRENLDDLVTAFEELLDELTPYYQERLRWLADQQREIVEYLCRQIHTVPVKEIATDLYLSDQAAAAQLKSLKDKGYVTAESVGRESRYELTEPLMRLCVEVKDPQREPIRLIVEFLRIWYDRAGVADRIQHLPADADLERRYFHAVLNAHRPDIPGPVEEALNRDLQSARASGDPEKVVSLLIELAATADTASRSSAVADELRDLGRYEEALSACDRAIALDPNYFEAWYYKALALDDLDRFEEALISHERAIKLNPDSIDCKIGKAILLRRTGRYEEALTACQTVIELAPRDPSTWIICGRTLSDLGRDTKALIAFEQSIEIDPTYILAWNDKGDALIRLGRYAEALIAFDRAIQLGSKFENSWNNKGYALNELDRHEEALAAYERAIQINPKYITALNNKGWTLNHFGRHEEALAALNQAIEIKPTDERAWLHRGRVKLALERTTDALDDINHAIELGETAQSLFETLATVHVLQGNWGEAERALSNLFQQPRSSELATKFRYLPDLIATLFRTSTDRNVWTHRVARLAEIGEDARKAREQTKAEKAMNSTPETSAEPSAPPDPLAKIGDALVRSLTNKFYAEATADVLDAWASVWRDVAKRHPDLSLAVRLFEVGLRYVQQKDERVLLDLVREERSILREFFGLVE